MHTYNNLSISGSGQTKSCFFTNLVIFGDFLHFSIYALSFRINLYSFFFFFESPM